MLRARRFPAVLLALCLFGGGLGMPLLDALAFHSSGAAESAATTDEWTRVHIHGNAHALGCSLWTCVASGTGLPSAGSHAPLVVPQADHPKYPLPAVSGARADLALSRSRAPPHA